MRIYILRVEFDRLLVVFDRIFILLQVVVGRCQVKVAFWAVVVDLKSLIVKFHRLIKEVQHVESVTQIVIRWCIPWIQFDRKLVVGDGFLIQLLDAQGVTEIVKRFRLL